MFTPNSKGKHPSPGCQHYLIRWRGKEVDLSRQLAGIKKKGIAQASSLSPEAREMVLHWATNLVLPAYEQVLRQPGQRPRSARHAAELPFPKPDIKLAVLLGIMFHDSELLARSGYLDKLYLAYTRLADFQHIEVPEADQDGGKQPPDSPAQQRYLACVRDDFAKLTRELQDFCAWLGIYT